MVTSVALSSVFMSIHVAPPSLLPYTEARAAFEDTVMDTGRTDTCIPNSIHSPAEAPVSAVPVYRPATSYVAAEVHGEPWGVTGRLPAAGLELVLYNTRAELYEST